MTERMDGEQSVDIYTDGACSGNPGPGGWGSVLLYGGHRRELSGGEVQTTNNRMEMMAVIAAMEALTRPCRVTIHTDSIYVMKGITEWLPQWKRRNWRTASKQPVKNVELWQRMEQVLAPHEVHWQMPSVQLTHSVLTTPQSTRSDRPREAQTTCPWMGWSAPTTGIHWPCSSAEASRPTSRTRMTSYPFCW